MQLYSDTISISQLEGIAYKHDMILYNITDFFGAKKRRCSFVLRPMHFCLYRKIGYTGRKLWAVNWEGHYLFMNDVFNLDNKAKIKTSIRTYNGRDEFLDLASSPPIHEATGRPMFGM